MGAQRGTAGHVLEDYYPAASPQCQSAQYNRSLDTSQMTAGRPHKQWVGPESACCEVQPLGRAQDLRERRHLYTTLPQADMGEALNLAGLARPLPRPKHPPHPACPVLAGKYSFNTLEQGMCTACGLCREAGPQGRERDGSLSGSSVPRVSTSFWYI